jgi:nanoRNase/pAp phosphatase (c-di-AMP/oligoRNAs hydrolase)
MERELTPKQQTSEAIRQAESILILTGQHPSVDQVAAATALSAILRKFGKKATAVITDPAPAAAQFLPLKTVSTELDGLRDFIVSLDMTRTQVDKVKYTIEDNRLNVHITPFSGGFTNRDASFSHGDYHFDLVIILGVATHARIDRVYAQNLQLLHQIPLVNIDFHRSNEQYGAINLIEPNAASLGEILVALSESLQPGLIDTSIATTVLAGIMAATDRFTATHTTSKALTVAAQMMAMGADQQQVVKGLYRSAPRKSEGSSQPQPKTSTDSQNRAQTNPQPIKTLLRAEVIRPRSNAEQSVVAISEPINPVEAMPIEQAAAIEDEPYIPNDNNTSSDRVSYEAQPLNDQPSASASTISSPKFDIPADDIESETDELLQPEEIKSEDINETPMTSMLEPLINQAASPRPSNSSQNRPRKAQNPTNNPVFADRLN